MTENKRERCTVFIVGRYRLPPTATEEQRARPPQSITEEENYHALLTTLQAAGRVVSHSVQYDTELNTAGIRVVFDKEESAKVAVQSLDGQRLFNFILSVNSSVFQNDKKKTKKGNNDDDDDEGEDGDDNNNAATAAVQQNALLPHNHLMPSGLQFFPTLLARLDEKRHGEMLSELKQVQAEAAKLQDEINTFKAAQIMPRQQHHGKQQQQTAAASSSNATTKKNADKATNVFAAAAGTTSAAEAAKRCVYFGSFPFDSVSISSFLVDLTVRHRFVIARWSLAAMPQQQQNQQPQQKCALLIQFHNEEGAKSIVEQFSVTGVGPQRAVPIPAADAVHHRWIAPTAFPLPPADVAALFGSREAGDVVRDLRAALKI